MTADPCTAARAWLSADRDGEAPDDPAARAHVTACSDCARWALTADRIAGRLRLQPAASPDVTSTAIAAFSEAAQAERAAQAEQASRATTAVRPPGHRAGTAVRALLAVAGAGGLLMAALTMTVDGFADPGGHAGYDLVAFEAALAVGLLLCAWQPERYARGLLPVALGVSLATLLPSGHLLAGGSDLLSEASHLPALAGATALLLDASARWSRRGGDAGATPGRPRPVRAT